jgi:hypothetical protein
LNAENSPATITSLLYQEKEKNWKGKSATITKGHADRLVLRLLAAGILTYSIKKNDNPKLQPTVELRWVLLDAANYKYAHQDKWRWRGIEHPLRMVRLRGKRVWCDYDRAEVQQQELEPDSSDDDDDDESSSSSSDRSDDDDESSSSSSDSSGDDDDDESSSSSSDSSDDDGKSPSSSSDSSDDDEEMDCA